MKTPLIALSAILLLFTAPLQGALILHYKLDQETGAAIDSASGRDGDLVGGSSWTNAVPPEFVSTHAYSNSGTNGSMISSGNVEELDSLGALTITGWIDVRSFNAAPGAQDRILSNRASSSMAGYFDFALYTVSGGTGLRFEMKTDESMTGNAGLNSSAIEAIDFASGWLYFAVTWDGATGAATISIGSTDASEGLQQVGQSILKSGTIDGRGNIFTIGNVAINTARAPEANYSDIRIYDNVLSSSELNAIRLENLQAIPEPSVSLALLSGVGLLLGAFRLKTVRNA